MTEPTCVICGANADNGYYDSLREQYYCDHGCFEDWADEHYEEVVDFYRRMNIE